MDYLVRHDYPVSQDTVDALNLIAEERCRQNLKWGEQNHDLPTWLTILVEEVGEFAEAVLDSTFGLDDKRYGIPDHDHVLVEITQVAAVATAIMEYLKRIERLDELRGERCTAAEVAANSGACIKQLGDIMAADCQRCCFKVAFGKEASDVGH